MVILYGTRLAYSGQAITRIEQALLEASSEGVLLLTEDCSSLKFCNAAARKVLVEGVLFAPFEFDINFAW